jgi:tRNA threonylcarbamoyladenosine biosynthesis protein TsaB
MLMAIDASTQWIGLALYDGAQVISEFIWRTHNHHSVELSPAIDELLKRSEVKPADLQALAIALGPGSFTSLRIGLAVVKGLSYALRLPIIGIPTLDILAAGIPVQPLEMAAVLQAGRGRLAVQWYDAADGKWASRGEPEIRTPHDLLQQIHQPTLVAGELDAEDRQVLSRRWKNVLLVPPAQSVRRPAYLAEIAWKRLQDGKVDDPISLAPIYLHVAGEIPA